MIVLGIVNFIIVLLLLAMAISFIMLLNVHFSAYSRQKKLQKYKKRLILAKGKHIKGENVLKEIEKYRTRMGIEALMQVIGESSQEDVQIIRQMAMETGFEAFIKKQLSSLDTAFCTLLIKLVGELRLQGFSEYILNYLYKNQQEESLQYVGFLTLSLLGEEDIILQICKDKNFKFCLSIRNFKEIFKHYSGNDAKLCEELLMAPDNYIKRAALSMIGEENLICLAEKAAGLLDDKDTNIVIDAIKALGQLKYAPAAEKLILFVTDEKWVIRNAVIRALAEIDIEEYAYIIEEGLHDSQWWVRYNAAVSLISYSKIKELIHKPAIIEDKFSADILRFAIQRAALLKGVKLR